MLCTVIKGPSFQDARQQIARSMPYANLVELRLDYFEKLDLDSLNALRREFAIPMIFTLRQTSQGGTYPGTEEARLIDIYRLAALKPEYLDLESCLPPQVAQEIALNHPEIQLIISYHDFERTPDRLDLLYNEIQKTPGTHYKIALKSNSILDELRVLDFNRQAGGHLITMSMGPDEQPSRILGPVFNIPITYSSIDESSQTAPGQLTAQKMVETYHFHSLNPDTKVYALIGDPVSRSISAETHNHLFGALGLNSVYIKFKLPPTQPEIAQFFNYAKGLGFHGLSVTTPLKEHLFPYIDILDESAKAIGAVNSILFEGKKTIGFNTDAPGALNAIEAEMPVKNKRIIIIGAGGAAKAIAYEACKREAEVVVLNRHPEKAYQLADAFHCKGGSLDALKAHYDEGYDVLINCTTSPMPVDPLFILPGALVMDINTKPKDTPFLLEAKKKGCPIIYGYKMFIEQAILQFSKWFKQLVDPEAARILLEQKSLEVLTRE